MFASSNQLGELEVIMGGLNIASSILGSYWNKQLAKKQIRLQREVANRQLALEERALVAKTEYDRKVLEMEQQRLNAWIESESKKLEMMANAPPLGSTSGMRIDPAIIQVPVVPSTPTILPSPGKGSYSMVIEEVEEPKTLLAGLGLPEEIMGIPTEVLLIGAGVAVLLLLD